MKTTTIDCVLHEDVVTYLEDKWREHRTQAAAAKAVGISGDMLRSLMTRRGLAGNKTLKPLGLKSVIVYVPLDSPLPACRTSPGPKKRK